MNDIGWTDREIEEAQERHNEIQKAYNRGYANAKNEFERRQGKWIDTGRKAEYYAEEFECSVCGCKDHWHNYCPNCGVKMVREDKGEVYKMKEYCGYRFDKDSAGNEMLVRNIRIDEHTLGGEFVMSKDEFIACYNRWVNDQEPFDFKALQMELCIIKGDMKYLCDKLDTLIAKENKE